MTKFNPCIIPVFTAILFGSCAVSGPKINLYGPAIYERDISYQPKPMSSDSVHHASYASLAYFSSGPANDKNSNDIIQGGQFNIGQGYTFDNFNLSYGAFGEVGDYQNQNNTDPTQPHYFANKSFETLGGRFSADMFINTGNVDVRFAGIEMAYSKQFGAYGDYVDALNGTANYFVNTRTNLFTIGGTSEVIWHSQRQPLQFGLRLFIGRTTGDDLYRNPTNLGTVYYPQTQTISLAYFMQVKKYFFVAEINPDGGMLRTGIRF